MKVKRLFGLVFHGCGVYNDQSLFNIAQHRKIITSYAAEEAMSCYDSPLVADFYSPYVSHGSVAVPCLRQKSASSSRSMARKNKKLSFTYSPFGATSRKSQLLSVFCSAP